MLVGKAARKCHLSQGQAMVAHQGLRPPDALMKQILVRGLSCALPEAANEVRRTDLCFTRQITQSKIAF